MDVLDLRQLNRATLARQGLLERTDADVATLVRRVGGLQAQTPPNPMVALWSRVAGFERGQLLDAIHAGTVVRGTTLRGTLHLHEVDEYRAMRMALQPTLDTLVNSLHRRTRSEDLEPALAISSAMIEEAPRTIGELKQAFKERLPHSDPQALGILVRYRMQLLMVPDPDAPNGYPHLARFAQARDLVGDTLDPTVDLELIVRRFLETLGPGSARDAQVWSGVRGLKDVMHAMRDAGELVTVTTFEGHELYDLHDAPRPEGDTPAAVRFLPMWDNLLLSHADRTRVLAPADKAYISSKNGMPPPTFLVDGFVHGTWHVERTGPAAELQLTPFGRTSRSDQDAVVAEGERLLAFLEPDARAVVSFGRR
jgi:hypothetical protein